MRTIVRNKKYAQGLAVALCAAMAFSTVVVPAKAAKKAKLSTTKVTVEVGKTKKVTVKNASKVTWTIKSGKKNITLSKKSKKGATIKGKKAGSAKIAVAMKVGKKTTKKTIKVTVKAAVKNVAETTATPTPVVTATATPTATPTATATPTITPVPTNPPADGFKREEVKLANVVGPEGDEGISYDPTTGVLHITDTPLFIYELPEVIPADSVVDVTVKGKLNGENGFRSYLINKGEDVALSGIANSDEDSIAGEFEWAFTLEADHGSEVSHIQFKGISHGTPIDDIEIYSIIVDYKPAQ